MLVMRTVLLLSRNGVPLSLLVVCQLVLVFDYLMFQFSEPVEQITEQVCSNCTLYADTLGRVLVGMGMKLIYLLYSHSHVHTHTHTHNLFSSSRWIKAISLN